MLASTEGEDRDEFHFNLKVGNSLAYDGHGVSGCLKSDAD